MENGHSKTVKIGNREPGKQAGTVYLRRPQFSVDAVRDDTTAECRWWNSLSEDERNALVHGAKTTRENARNDWLDIGETNRMRILDAAYAVECWMSTD